MYPLSNNRIPNRDLNYVNPLLDSVSNRSEAAGEKVLKLIQDLKATFIDQKQSYQENSGQYKDLKNRLSQVISDLSADIKVVSQAKEKLTKESLEVEKIKTVSNPIVSTTSIQNPHDLQEDIIPIISSSDLDSDELDLNSGHLLVSSALQLVEGNLKDLIKLKQLTEGQLVLLERHLEASVTLKVKELAFRIFYDKRTLPSEIDEKLAGSTQEVTLQKVIEDLELKDSQGELVFKKVLGDEKYYICLSQLKDLQKDMNLFYKYRSETNLESKEAYLDEIVNRYSSLLNGQSKLFQGGYNSDREDGYGHSVVYEFKRLNDDLFELRLFNTGEGKHPRFGARVQSYYLNLDKMKDKEFLRGLLAFKVLADNEEKAGPGSARSMQDVMAYLNENLGPCDYQESIPPQTWGNCTYMTLKAWLHNKLDTKSYETFHKLSREHAASQLKEYLPTLSEEVKQRVFGDSVISKINKKISVMSWESVPILGRIVKLFYYFTIQISNWFKKPDIT
jgi:hypothetical protein